MNRCILILIILLINSIPLRSKADHIIGYDMTLVNVKNGITPTDNYKFRLKFFRQYFGISLPTSFTFSIRENGSNNQLTTFTVSKTNTQTYITYSPSECPAPVSNINNYLELGIYESAAISMTNYNNALGYYVVCTTSSREPSSNFGNIPVLLMTMDFPRLNILSTTRFNSSPEFKSNPLTYFIVGKPYSINYNVQDPDGDSLVFSLSQPISESTTKPFVLVPFSFYYGFNNYLDGLPDLSINSNTGAINFTGKRQGNYLVSIKCEEYRNGVKIGEIRRELSFLIWAFPEAPPEITDSKNRIIISDTVNINGNFTYTNRFKVTEKYNDSIYFKLLPQEGEYNDITNQKLFDIKFGKINGPTYSGSSIKNLLLKSKDSLLTNFTWNIDSTDIKDTPYQFKLIAFDKTCPTPLTDTLSVELLILGQCYNRTNINIKGCDSIIDYMGRIIYSDTLIVDTIQAIIGCDTIINQFIKISNSSKQIQLNDIACDSILGIDGIYYYSDTIVKRLILNSFGCDSINIIQKLTIYNTPKSLPIRGVSSIIDTSISYYYGVDWEPNLIYDWEVNNGKIISGNLTNLVEVKWSNKGKGEISCTYYFDSLCKNQTRYSINVSVGLNNSETSKLKIYPNPTNEIINIEGLESNNITSINIYDIQGKLILTKELIEKGTIDLSELGNGVYVVKIGEIIQRILKI